MRVLVVDDEPVARRRLLDILSSIEDVELAGEACNTSEAIACVAASRPDVMLLDINMPGEDGMSFALREKQLPPIIFTTASEDRALAAFEASAVDYLVKPVRKHRLERALAKVVSRAGNEDAVSQVDELLARTSANPEARIRARQGDTTYLFDPREIERFYAADKYSCFEHGGREFLLEESLSALAKRLARQQFVRVHRAELVSLRHVRALSSEDGGFVVELASGARARVSRRAAAGLRSALRQL